MIGMIWLVEDTTREVVKNLLLLRYLNLSLDEPLAGMGSVGVIPS